MPRLSMWREHKSADYNFLDRTIKEQFLVGGTAFLVHKYIGPKAQTGTSDATLPEIQADADELTIQDVLFLENRDRKYDPDVYELRGVYNVGDQDFDLTQFGLFLNTDVLFITFHTNDMIDRIGRKLMAGDVIELPHLRDDALLDPNAPAINKFYVIQDAARAAEGFSQTWFPHIWRIKAAPMSDAQEYKDIISKSAKSANGLRDLDETGSGVLNPANGTGSGDTLLDHLSTYNKELAISDAIVKAAEDQLPLDPLSADTSNLVNDQDSGFVGHGRGPFSYDYGEPIPTGVSFPTTARQGDMFLRTDYTPNRLFVYRGTRWHRLYDNIDMRTYRTRNLNAADYVDNPRTTIIGGQEVPERQALSKVVKPKTDV